MTTEEWRLKNYLNKHDIHRDDNDMQTIIINSFVCSKGFDNDAGWKDKLAFCQDNFGTFAMYAHNNWKHGKIHSKTL